MAGAAAPARPGCTIAAAKLKLKPGQADEYRKRHDGIRTNELQNIWPDDQIVRPE